MDIDGIKKVEPDEIDGSELRRPDFSFHQIVSDESQDLATLPSQPVLRPVKKAGFDFRANKKNIFIGSGVALLIILMIGGFFWWQSRQFNQNSVSFFIDGPNQVVGGEDVNYFVRYKNNSAVDLNDAEVVFTWPDGTVLSSVILEDASLIEKKNLGTIKRGSLSDVQFRGKLIGIRDAVKEVKAVLSYQPANFQSRFENSAKFQSSIVSVPLVLNFNLTPKIVSGQSINFNLQYSNTSQADMKDMVLKITYPDGFKFTSSSPVPSEANNIWQLGTLNGRSEGKINIAGVITGDNGATKSFTAQIGYMKDNNFVSVADGVGSLQISISPLFIDITAPNITNNTISAGGHIDYILNYKNTTTETISSVIITVKLIGEMVDLPNVEARKGVFSSSQRTITWNAGSVSALDTLVPGEEGQLDFRVPLKSTITQNNSSDKNFSIIAEAKIDSPITPLALTGTQISGSANLEIKVSSQVSFDAQGFYNDGDLLGSGPIPPRVGQTTTYTLKWLITNRGNDLENVTVSAYLPSNVAWLNKVLPAGNALKYNQSTGQLIWNIGNLQSGTGIISPAKQVSWQVSVTPSSSDVGKEMILMNKSTFSSFDSFANIEISATDNAITTQMPDDSQAKNKGKVIQ